MENFWPTFLDLSLDAIKDTLLLIPFLLATYLLMEFLERRYSKKTQEIVSKAGHVGPLIGGLFGIFPQCGFSASAATFYAARVITLGTLFGVFLSCSDEMLPIMIAKHSSLDLVMSILGIKLVISVFTGFLVDAILRIGRIISVKIRIEELCERDNCNCHSGHSLILKSAIIHTLQITAFVFILTMGLNITIELIGEDRLIDFMTFNQELSVLASAVIGLIPNCAASVLITDLYLEGILSFGSMMSGLLVGTGVGILVLFRTNRLILINLIIVFMLLLFGVIWGLVLNSLNLGLF
ncbi:MAG: arsenic efflux protein [Eggerthellaceae bacterium]|nr:arsenic efflux protein [Eggerthellaceae bacterium]